MQKHMRIVHNHVLTVNRFLLLIVENLVNEVVVAAEKRQTQIDGLKPSTKYSVIVAAEYSDGSL